MSRCSLLGAVAVAALLLVVPSAGAAACPKGFSCSSVPVPLDRSGTVPGTIELFVARDRSSAAPGKPMLLGLTGGPGQAAVPFARSFARQLGPALRRYQLVVFDQRGTGRSGALRCAGVQGAPADATTEATEDATGACGRSLGDRAGLYSTAASVEDIEAVRRAVGADKVALLGTSYGTHVIQRYVLAHPDRVDRAVLDSPVQPGGVDALQADTFAAVPRVLGNLSPVAVPATAALTRRLSEAPVRGPVYSATGRRHVAAITNSGELFGLLVAGDQSEFLRSQYPQAVRAAVHGDAAPLLRLGAAAGLAPEPKPTELSAGLYAATVCTDVRMPWAPTSDPASREPLLRASLAALPADAGAPFDRRTIEQSALSVGCEQWPATTTQPDQVPAAYPSVPALVLVGLSDVRTPLESAKAITARWSDAGLVTVPGTGHDVLGSDQTGCARRTVLRFLAGGAARDTVCRRSNGLDRASRRFPTSLSQLPQTGGHGRPARAFTAAIATVQDAERVVLGLIDQVGPGRFGGLRGGDVRWTLRHGSLLAKLDHYAYVPGVAATGTIAFDGRAPIRLRLSGRVHGIVRADRSDFQARIDGHVLRLGKG